MPLLARLAAPWSGGLRGIDRRVYLVVSMTLVSVAARMSVYTFLGIYFTRDAGIALSLVGGAYLVENLLRGLVAPLAGALSDRVGRKPVLLASMLLATLVMPAFLLVREPWHLFAWAASLGVAMSGAWPVTSALLLDLTSPEQRRAVLGLNYTALSIGYTIGVAPAGFLLGMGFGALAAASAAGFTLVAVLLAFLRRVPRPVVEAGPRRSLVADLAVAPRDRAFLLLASLSVVFPLGIGLIATVAPLYAEDEGLSVGAIGLALAVNGPLLAVFSIPVSTALTRFGPYRHLVYAGLLLAASYVPLAVGGGFGLLVAASVVFTVGELIFGSALPTAVGSLAPPGLRGAYQGAWALVHSFGFGAAVFATGLLQPAVGWRATWLAWVALTTVAAVGLALARPRFRQLADARADAALKTPAGAAAADGGAQGGP